MTDEKTILWQLLISEPRSIAQLVMKTKLQKSDVEAAVDRLRKKQHIMRDLWVSATSYCLTSAGRKRMGPELNRAFRAFTGIEEVK